MLASLKLQLQKSKMIIILYHIFSNGLSKTKSLLGEKEHLSGSTHAGMSLNKSLDYIDQVFNDYLRYSGIPKIMIKNKRVLEIGPGDNLGVALKFLIAGAKQVVCLDKFYSKRDFKQQFRIYQELRARLNEDEKEIYDHLLNLNGEVYINNKKLKYFYNIGIEKASKILEPASFDFIFSRAVIEHIYDPDVAFKVMNNLLKPGGIMIHMIDFRDHGLFSKKGFHPLTYLTIPELFYKLMTFGSDKPNRRLINYYRNKMLELGYDYKILITQIVGEDNLLIPFREAIFPGIDYSEATISLVKEIRPFLSKKFINLSDEELLVQGIFLVAKKPPY